MLCSNADCEWFGYDHDNEHPCGRRPAGLGENCEHCGVEVKHVDGCMWCWTPVTAL